MTNWESFLQEYDEEFENIHVDSSGNVRLPDGNYQVTVDSTMIEESQTKRVLWKTTFKVLTGDFQGRLIFHVNVLDDPDRLQYVKQDCYRLGFPIGKLSDLPSKLEDMLDTKVEVKLKTNGEYQNCYIQKRLDANAEQGSKKSTSNKGEKGGRPKPPSVEDVYGDIPDITDDDLPF